VPASEAAMLLRSAGLFWAGRSNVGPPGRARGKLKGVVVLRRSFALALVLGVTLAACTSQQAAPTASGAATALPSVAAPGEKPQTGGTLTFIVNAEPPSFDGHRETTFALLHPIAPHYSLLYKFDPNNLTKVIPDVAVGLHLQRREAEAGHPLLREEHRRHRSVPLRLEHQGTGLGRQEEPGVLRQGQGRRAAALPRRVQGADHHRRDRRGERDPQQAGHDRVPRIHAAAA